MFEGDENCTGETITTQSSSINISTVCGMESTAVHSNGATITDPSPLNKISTSHVTSTLGSSPPSFQDFVESLADYKASLAVWCYCPPVVLALGTLGNLMILRLLGMFFSTSLPSMSIYFRALAVSDLTLLYTGLLRNWIKYVFLLDIRDTHSAVCKTHIFLVYVTSMTSAWFLVMMTSQRALSVVWPHKMRRLHSRKMAFVTVAVTVGIISLLNIHHLYGYEVRSHPSNGLYYCDYVNSDYENFTRFSWSWIDLCMSSLLPFCLLLTSNSLLMWKVTTSIRDVKKLTNTGTKSQKVVSQRQKQSTSLNVTLIFLSAMFFLLTSPVCVFLVLDLYSNFGVDAGDANRVAANSLGWAVTNLLWYANSAINFYLYCLTGSRFRAQVRQCLCCVMSRHSSRTAKADSGEHLQRRADLHEASESSSHM